MKNLILSVDLGTTSMKTVLYSSELKTLHSVQKFYLTNHTEDNGAEQDPQMWWKLLCDSTSEIFSESGFNSSDVAAVGIDTMSSAVVPLDIDGNPIHPAMLWLDRRAEIECRQIDSIFGNDFFKIAGNHNDPSNFGPKVMWLKKNRSEIYNKTDIFLHANGYLVRKLTGNNTMDVTECGLSQLCRTSDSQWSKELLNGCGIAGGKLPDIFESTEIAGTVTSEAASLSGLMQGTPVVCGSMDNAAAGAGAGLYRNREVYVSAGTVTTVNCCIEQPDYDSRMHLYRHSVHGKWLSVAGVDYGGAGLKWFKELLGEESFEVVNTASKQAEPNQQSPMFLPYMVGQRAPLWNNDTKGVFFGLTPDTTRNEMYRALMEGNVLGVRTIIDIQREKGIFPDAIRLTGGCSNSRVWAQMFADILNCTISIPGNDDVASLGAAVTAGVGTGIFGSFEEAADMISVRESFFPDGTDKTTQLNHKRSEIFKMLYSGLEPVFRQLNTYGEIK